MVKGDSDKWKYHCTPGKVTDVFVNIGTPTKYDWLVNKERFSRKAFDYQEAIRISIFACSDILVVCCISFDQCFTCITI